jgi:hypothetical protein
MNVLRRILRSLSHANPSTQDVVRCLEFIVEGRPYVWDDFTDVPIRNPKLDKIRLELSSLQTRYPSRDGSAYLSAEGLAIVREIIRTLRSEEADAPGA